eukprot:gene20825-28826_t
MAAGLQRLVVDTGSALETIGDQAFSAFKGNVQLVGEFSRLSSIGGYAFLSASNSASRVEIECRSNEWLVNVYQAFLDFKGTRVPDGEQVVCITTTTTPTTITSTVTTATATTTTSSTFSSTTTTLTSTTTATTTSLTLTSTFTSTTSATTVTDTATTTSLTLTSTTFTSSTFTSTTATT